MKPILFNTEMVRAILDGRKTVTRRVVKPQPKMPICYCYAGYKNGCWGYPGRTTYISWGNKYRWPKDMTAKDERRWWNPPCHVDDILYVRETFTTARDMDGKDCYVYKVYDPNRKILEEVNGQIISWTPSIHMPKEAARIFLRVTNVSVEQLHEISGGELAGEGIDIYHGNMQDKFDEFARLWNRTIKPKDRDKYGWEANPWVWLISFGRIEGNT